MPWLSYGPTDKSNGLTFDDPGAKLLDLQGQSINEDIVSPCHLKSGVAPLCCRYIIIMLIRGTSVYSAKI
jgi:hypothetical protein